MIVIMIICLRCFKCFCDLSDRQYMCLFSVDEELHVKVCDNALARDFFPGDYHCLGDNENRPVRWMAVEALETNTFCIASDVVSQQDLSVFPMTLFQSSAAIL